MNPFDIVKKSNNVFGQGNVFFSLLFGCLILVKGKDKESIFEVLGSIWLIVFPFAVAPKLGLENFHDEIDVIELDLFFLFIKDFGDEFVDFSGSPSQFRVKMIFNVVVTSLRHFLSNSRPFVTDFAVELEEF